MVLGIWNSFCNESQAAPARFNNASIKVFEQVANRSPIPVLAKERSVNCPLKRWNGVLEIMPVLITSRALVTPALALPRECVSSKGALPFSSASPTGFRKAF